MKTPGLLLATTSLLFMAMIMFTLVPSCESQWISYYYASTIQASTAVESRFALPLLRRFDASLNFTDNRLNINNWNFTSTPLNSFRDYYAVRSSGILTVTTTGLYRFFVIADDGVRVYLNETLVMDGWRYQTGAEYNYSVTLTANAANYFRVEYFQHTQGAFLLFSWSSATFNRTIVPASVVKPDLRWFPGVKVGGFRFSTLDAVLPTSTNKSCSLGELELPSGMMWATDSPLARVAVASWPWAADCLILNGSLIDPSTNDVCKFIPTFNLRTVLNTNIGLTNSLSQLFFSVNCPVNLAARIFVMQPDTTPFSASDEAPSIPSFVLDGFEYGVHDGVAPDALGWATPCNKRFLRIPAGWDLVPLTNNKTLLAAVSSPFAASRLVYGGGFGVNTGWGTIETFLQIESITATEAVYYRAAASTVCQRLLIRRPTIATNTFITAFALTNILSSKTLAFDYATLDNSAILGDGTIKCQNRFLRVPDGWSLANRNPDLEALINQASLTFGANCITYAGALGYLVIASSSTTNRVAPCQVVIRRLALSDGVYLMPNDCSTGRKLLLQRAKALGPPDLPCASCLAWGDPHITTFGGKKLDFYGMGEFIYSKPNSSLPQDWIVYTKQHPVKSATANIAVNIRYLDETLTMSVIPNATKLPPTFSRNGQTIPDLNGELQANVSIKAAYVTNQLLAILPNQVQVKARWNFWNMNLIDLTVIIPNSLAGKTEGICGSCGDTSASFFVFPNGTRVSSFASHAAGMAFGLAWAFPPTYRPPNSSTTTVAPTTTTTTTTTPTTAIAFVPSDQPQCTNPIALSLAQTACESVRAGGLFNECVVDTCNSGSTAAVQTALSTVITQNAELWGGVAGVTLGTSTTLNTTIAPPQLFCPVSLVDLSNTLTINGRIYATLDFAQPASSALGGQTNWLSVPPGWEIAKNTPITRSALACLRFGTTCFVLADGVALNKDLIGCGETVINFNNITGVSTGTNLVQSQDGCVRPKVPPARILITKAIAAPSLNQLNWRPIGNGFDVSLDESLFGSSAAIKFTGITTTTTTTTTSPLVRGAQVSFNYNSDQPFSIGIWSRATDVSPLANDTNANTISMSVSITTTDGGTSAVGSLNFDLQQTSFHFREVDVPPTANLQSVTITLSSSFSQSGGYIFSDLQLTTGGSTFGGGNLLRNPTVRSANGWQPFGGGFRFTSLQDSTRFDGSGSLMMMTSATETLDNVADYGALQVIELSQKEKDSLQAIYFRGTSMGQAVGGTYKAGWSLYLDVIYDDGSSTWGVNAPFDANVTGWQTSEKYFKIPIGKKVSRIQFVALVRKRTGTFFFDNLFLSLLDCDTGSTSATNLDGSSYGDPHLVTLDGHAYDCHAVGDFVLFRDATIDIVARHSVAGNATVNSMITVIYKKQTLISFERATKTNQPHITINRDPILLFAGQSYLIDPIAILIASGSFSSADRAMRYDLEFPNTNHKVMITAHLGSFGVQWLQVYPKPPISSMGKASGLLGNFNNKPEDDFIGADGIAYDPIKISHEDFYGKFVESWRFDGEIANLEPSNELGTPTTKTPMSIGDYPAEMVQKAKTLCRDITAGFLEGCMLDFLLTGDQGVAAAYSFIDGVVGVTAIKGGALTNSVSPSPTPTSSPSGDSSSSSGVNLVAIIVPCVLGGVLVVGILIFAVIWRKEKSHSTSATQSNLSV